MLRRLTLVLVVTIMAACNQGRQQAVDPQPGAGAADAMIIASAEASESARPQSDADSDDDSDDRPDDERADAGSGDADESPDTGEVADSAADETAAAPGPADTADDVPASEAAESAPLTGLKADAAELIDGNAKLTQEIVDSLFSFAELGFQEFQTQRYLSSILEANGFDVAYGVAGIPSAWWATWGEGEPVIALGSDVDGIPKASQMPGVAYRQPMIEGAPGHGEGHNSGQAVNITAAIAVKALMERDDLPGTIQIWPGIAEELVAAKAWYARDGLFDDVDAVLFTHVDDRMKVDWGRPAGTGLVSVEYTFEGVAAHGAGDPWKGRSALDAVELMNVAWNFRREHLHPLQRSHYVITDGGDQPNVVPSTASVWYFIREITADAIRENFDTLQRIAEGAAMMTDTELSRQIVGTAYPRHYNRPIAEAMQANMLAVGMPEWSEDDQAFAKALQELMNADEITGLRSEVDDIGEPEEEPRSGGSDDIGDVSWNVPTVTLRFPSNVDGLQFHHWSSAMAMATPIAHKGATAGAKVIAATMIDMLTEPKLLADARRYFDEVQTAEETYQPFIGPDDPPAIAKNARIMLEFRDRLAQYYYDPSRYDTYLEQLGIDYPQLSPPAGAEAAGDAAEPTADESAPARPDSGDTAETPATAEPADMAPGDAETDADPEPVEL